MMSDTVSAHFKVGNGSILKQVSWLSPNTGWNKTESSKCSTDNAHSAKTMVNNKMSLYSMLQHGLVATHPVKGNAVFLQDGWRYQRHLVAEEGIAALGTAREEACREVTVSMRYSGHFANKPNVQSVRNSRYLIKPWIATPIPEAMAMHGSTVTKSSPEVSACQEVYLWMANLRWHGSWIDNKYHRGTVCVVGVIDVASVYFEVPITCILNSGPDVDRSKNY